MEFNSLFISLITKFMTTKRQQETRINKEYRSFYVGMEIGAAKKRKSDVTYAINLLSRQLNH